jgi:hypothetical protein
MSLFSSFNIFLTFLHAITSFVTIRWGLSSCNLKAEIRTRACLTAGRHTTQLSYATPYCTTQSPTELSCTLLSYAAPFWATPHPWATPHLTELNRALLSYSEPYAVRISYLHIYIFLFHYTKNEELRTLHFCSRYKYFFMSPLNDDESWFTVSLLKWH